jgi:hypothetical protein
VANTNFTGTGFTDIDIFPAHDIRATGFMNAYGFAHWFPPVDQSIG